MVIWIVAGLHISHMSMKQVSLKRPRTLRCEGVELREGERVAVTVSSAASES